MAVVVVGGVAVDAVVEVYVVVVVGDGGGGVVVGGDGGCNSSDSEFRPILANGCDTAYQGGGVSYWLARRLILARVHEALGVYRI